MNRILTVGVLSAALSACVGPVDTESSSSQANSQTNSSAQSSAPVVSSSSVTVSSSSVAVSSSSVVSSSSSAASSESGFDGDAGRGATLFGSKCTNCHADTNGDGYFDDAQNPFDPDELGTPDALPAYDASTKASLASFITASMSPFAGGCDEQCGEDIAAYLWLQKNGLTAAQQIDQLTELTCSDSAPDAIHYGKRTLHVLTSYEYHNSLAKLFGAPLPADYSSPAKVSVDTEIARLPNHTNEALGETRLNQYYENATELADWAISTPGALTFDCSDPETCATNFVNDFAYVAYRRLLTAEESADFRGMITGASDANTGLKWAITTALTSSHFLYRSELGRTVAEALVEEPPAPDPNAITIVDSVIVESGDVTYNAAGVADYGPYKYSGVTPNYNWSGNDVLKVSVGGKGKFGLSVDNRLITEMDINSSGMKVYTFEITHAMGTGKFVQTYNQSGDTLKVSKLTIGKVGVAEPPAQEDKTLLERADADAYVLSQFEFAAALSYALTGSGPSRELLDAAKAGELFDEASLDSHIDALIDSQLGQAHVERLAGKWFRTDGLPGETRNVPEYTPQVRDSMMQEIREIFKHVFYNGDFPSMYEGDYTFLDSTLAAFYGMQGNGGSSHGDFRFVDTTGTLRGGIIASGGFMTYNAHMDYTSPIQRGAHFRQDVLCQAIPQPVNLEDSEEREIAGKRAADRADAGNITTAEYFDIQTNVTGSSCAGCHNAIINPLFGMDDFDNVGRLRKRVNGDVVQVGLLSEAVDENTKIVVPKGDADLPIDFVNNDGYLFSPNVVGTLSAAQADADKATLNGIKFKGAKDLGKKIVENELPGVSACLIEKTTRYAMGYTLNKELLEDAEKKGASYLNISDAQEAEFVCVQDELEAAYATAKSPRDVLKALVKSSAFRFRK